MCFLRFSNYEDTTSDSFLWAQFFFLSPTLVPNVLPHCVYTEITICDAESFTTLLNSILPSVEALTEILSEPGSEYHLQHKKLYQGCPRAVPMKCCSLQA